jgi:hypoxanthine phosphoribosyltransferase
LPQLQTIYTPEEIKGAVERLAREISRDYQDKNPLFLGVLKGSFMFMADLIRNLDMPLEVEFVALSSYGQDTKSSGKVNVVQGLCTSVKDKDVLIIEDIIDTGITLNFLIEYLQCEKPASLKICALFDKVSRRQVPLSIDYLGLSVPDVFVVGYGLDYDEKFRHLPGLHFLKEEV